MHTPKIQFVATIPLIEKAIKRTCDEIKHPEKYYPIDRSTPNWSRYDERRAYIAEAQDNLRKLQYILIERKQQG